MKKIIIIAFMSALLIILVFSAYINPVDKDLKSKFERWDNGQLKNEEGTETLNSLVNYLINNPQISAMDLQNLSTFLKVYEKDNFKLIEYIENPEFYGNSSRGSYHVVMYDGKVEVIDINGSTKIYEIVKLNDYIYHVYAVDYRATNITGINIFDIIIDEQGIKSKPVIYSKSLISGFEYNEIDHVLYYNEEHIYYKEIKDNGNQIVLSVKDKNYAMFYEEDGLYHLTEDG